MSDDIIEPKDGSPSFFELELSLKDDLGIDFQLNPNTARQLGLSLADVIRTRTRDQQSPLTGGAFARYSDEYAEKKGVSPTEVDLTLLGDMLDSITVTDVFTDRIVLGFDDTNQVPKAYNHHTGDTVPARPFFGLTRDEIDDVKRNLSERLKDEETKAKRQRQKEERLQEVADEEVDRLVNAITSSIRFSFRPPGD